MERELPRFSDRSHKEEQPNNGQKPRPCKENIGRYKHAQLDKVHRTKCDLNEQNAEQHAEITDARRDERLLRRLIRRSLFIIKADQQIGAKPDPLPEHIELEEIDRSDKPKHRR